MAPNKSRFNEELERTSVHNEEFDAHFALSLDQAMQRQPLGTQSQPAGRQEYVSPYALNPLDFGPSFADDLLSQPNTFTQGSSQPETTQPSEPAEQPSAPETDRLYSWGRGSSIRGALRVVNGSVHSSETSEHIVNLNSAQSERWPWGNLLRGPSDASRRASFVPPGNNSHATRSESAIFGTPSHADTSALSIASDRSNWIEPVQDTSRRSFHARPRHEVDNYRRRSISTPPTPKGIREARARRVSEAVPPAAPAFGPRAALRQGWVPDHVTKGGEEPGLRSELVTEGLKAQVRNHIIGPKQSTWVTRLEKRAVHYKKARELLAKKVEGIEDTEDHENAGEWEDVDENEDGHGDADGTEGV